ncbi:MAG TPA: ABC transporter ATP-binding protein [Geminicoccaceae bacterium]
MLELERVDAAYGETQVLFDVSLEVGAGEVVALLGANGAGKTTTLRAILGLTPATAGTVRFKGRDITRLATHLIARQGIGWVPDDRRVFPTLSVERNLAIARKPSPFKRWSMAEVGELFTALPHLMQRSAENLSGGEMQMVAISRALMGGPALLLLDEPSQGLAPKIVQDVMRTIRRTRDEGISVLLVEQHARNALEVADRTYVMDLGRIVHEGPARALLDDPELAVRLVGER